MTGSIKKAQQVLIKYADDKTKANILRWFGVGSKNSNPTPTGWSKFTLCYTKQTKQPNVSYRLFVNESTKDFVSEKIVDNTVVEKVCSSDKLH